MCQPSITSGYTPRKMDSVKISGTKMSELLQLTLDNVTEQAKYRTGQTLSANRVNTIGGMTLTVSRDLTPGLVIDQDTLKFY